MAEDVDDLIRQAAAVLSEAMDEAAALALAAVERYGASLQPFCKQAAEQAGMPDAWNALRVRAQRLRKASSEGPDERTSTLADPTSETDKAAIRHARRVLREAPEQVLADPEIRASVQEAVDRIDRQDLAEMAVIPKTRIQQDEPGQIMDLLNEMRVRGLRAVEIRQRPRTVPLSPEHEQGFRLMGDKIRAILEVIETGRDVDAELRDLLAEGA